MNSWLTSGSLGQALCKLAPLADISSAVSIESLVLIVVDRFGAVVFPLWSPLISSKPCTFFTFASWIIAMAVISPYFVAYKLVEYADGEFSCELQWNDAFGEASSIENYYIALYVVFNFIPFALLTILYSIILIKLKTNHPGKPSANAEQQRAKRNRSVLKMAIAIVLGFVLCWVPWSVINLLIVLAWDSRLPCAIVHYYDIASVVHGLVKLCHQSFYLLYFQRKLSPRSKENPEVF